MSTENTQNSRRAVNRRTVTTGLAWSVPAVAATAAAPFAAASLIKNPGINGWVSVGARSVPFTRCTWDVTVTSNLGRGAVGPDGAPYGLYLYDTDPRGRYDAAKLVYWVRGDHTGRNNLITWHEDQGHSDCWSGPTTGTRQVKDDGHIYTPYTWDYLCDIDPNTVSSDGRLYLGDFSVRARINQNLGNRCEPLDFWAYREIRVDADGDGPAEPQLMHFERKASLAGGSGNRSRDEVGPNAATDQAEATEADVVSDSAAL